MADGRMPYSGMNAPPRFDLWKPRRQRRWVQNNAPPGLGKTPPKYADLEPKKGADYPPPQSPPPAFMPYMPSYEAGLRGLEDDYARQRMDLTNQMNLVGPQLQAQQARLGTDKEYANDVLDEAMVDRGMFDSGANATGRIRDIDIPYGRQYADLAQWAATQTGDIQTALSELGLNYSQGLAELILNNAAEAAGSMPMNIPMFEEGYKGVEPDWKPKKLPKKPKPPRKKNDRGKK